MYHPDTLKLCTYLTNYRVLTANLMVAQWVKKLPTYFWNWRFYYEMPLWTLSQGTCIWSKPSHCISVRSRCNRISWAVAGLKPAGRPPSRHVLNLRPVRMEFIVDRVALRQVFLPVFQFSSVSIILPMLHTHSFVFHQHYVMTAVNFQETSFCYAFWLKCHTHTFLISPMHATFSAPIFVGVIILIISHYQMLLQSIFEKSNQYVCMYVPHTCVCVCRHMWTVTALSVK